MEATPERRSAGRRHTTAMAVRLLLAGAVVAAPARGLGEEPDGPPPPPPEAHAGRPAGETLEEPGPQQMFEEEIVVSATRREKSIETVPVSILAVSGDDLRQNRIDSLEELSRFVPNLFVGDEIRTTGVTIRGMGAQPERGFEQSTALFVDGIYLPRSRQYRRSFVDVTQVEVLRGPQAVLFGLNATAGAVSVFTNRSRPGDKAFADISAEYETRFGGPRLTAVLGGSPSDRLGLRLAARYGSGGDFYLNEFHEAQEGGVEEGVVRLSAVYDASRALNVDVKYEHGTYGFDGDLGEQFGPSELHQLLFLGLPGGDDGHPDWRRTMDRALYAAAPGAFDGRDGPGLSQEHDDFSVNAGIDVGGGNRLSAILGHSRLSYDSWVDSDAGPLPVMVTGFEEQFDQTSFELLWTSPAGRTVDYLVGGYVHGNELNNEQPNVFEPTVTTAPGAYGFDHVFTSSSFTTTSRLWSVFGTATWNISPSLRLSGGGRYVDERKKHRRGATCVPIRGGVIDFDPGPEDRALFEENREAFLCATLDGFSDERRSTSLMPEAAVEWNATADTLGYAQYSESAKSGGFAASTIVVPETIGYDEEGARSFELGLRSRLAGGRGRVNFALFRTVFADLQVAALDPVTAAGFITNAADARSRGIEVDGGWYFSRRLWVTGAFAWLDAKYTRFPDAPCPISQVLAGVEPPCDASGKRMPRAPEITASLGVNLSQPVGRGASGPRLQAALNLGYTGDYGVDASLEPAFVQGSYLLMNARVALASSDDRWSLALVGTNLTNEAVLNSGIPFFTNIGYLGAPRMLAVQASYRFGTR